MNKDCCRAPVERDVIPPEILDLLRFMCATWTEIDRFVYQHCDGNALMQYPVVQGTGNQIKLQRIGEQPFDKANIHKAVEWMQQYNAELTRLSLINKMVRVRMTVEYEVEVPASWDRHMIEFHRNEGSWCSDNALYELEKLAEDKGCLCHAMWFECLDEHGNAYLDEE
jgi:hypothetical protein